MIIKNAEFIISAVGPKQYPDDGLPEIALAGRSNVCLLYTSQILLAQALYWLSYWDK